MAGDGPGEQVAARTFSTAYLVIQLSNVAIRPTSDAHGDVAQLGEHLPCKQGVKSSNLSISIGTTFRTTKQSTRWAAGTLTNSYRSEWIRTIRSKLVRGQGWPWTTTSKTRTGPCYARQDGPRKYGDRLRRLRANSPAVNSNGVRETNQCNTKGQAKKSAGRMPWH